MLGRRLKGYDDPDALLTGVETRSSSPVKLVRDTVASLRLDSVLAAGFSLSRGRAAEAVEKGSVQVNYVTCVKPDKPVSAGDTITCRGLGKCVLDSVGAPTKKGRLPVAIRRYI